MLATKFEEIEELIFEEELKFSLIEAFDGVVEGFGLGKSFWCSGLRKMSQCFSREEAEEGGERDRSVFGDLGRVKARA